MAQKRPRRKRYLYLAVFQPDNNWCCEFGCDGRGRGYMQAYHRHNVDDSSPYAVANEWICGCLGRFIGLSVPPCALTFDPQRKEHLFSSLDFNFEREELPPILPDICASRLPEICTGIVLFDVLIANEDRHDENLAVDSQIEPSEIRVFDHDQALFGGGNRLVGLERFDALEDHPGILGCEVTRGVRHCLLDYLSTSEYFEKWFSRFYSIPDWYIRDLCSDGRLRLKAAERKAAAKFLIHRKKTLSEIVRNHRGEFPGIGDWDSSTNLWQK